MTTRMLIDAAHPEETRVVVTRGNKVEEFDFESASRRPLRGNIYLAKVTRVEPSLQAAFVDFGGNRHGFLAFSEIHPDYYQIPTADRMALLAEEAEAARNEEADEDERGRSRRRSGPARPKRNRDPQEKATAEAGESEPAEPTEAGDPAERSEAAGADQGGAESEPGEENAGENSHSEGRDGENGKDAEEVVEQLGGGGDAMEEVPTRASHRSRRQYKIQEVIKRRQILLVQVVKEERGTKGAALTTYLSLAGRYSVLMPNTARGGGISRKITNSVDRKRLKSMAAELEVPDGMGVILRTAGASRTKVEVKRDFEYLMRLWESVRNLTLESTAPALVYEEGSLIKRAIRDLYSKDIEDIQVAGDEGYREAKDFMRMLMPSHAKVVQPYKESAPLFSRFGVESQLDAMFSNVVTLKSGGYIVLNQTEALVAIDVNSGRSTREHNIEDTALKTNLEAAEEVARQLRLRDLAGLIVIDFIDMEEKRNNKAVERKLNDCLKNDRARIQVGRISHFGLLEMSRQRIRTGVLESSTAPCPHCAGTGLLRSTPSLALHVLRALEETLLRNATHDIILRTRIETALYVLNQKRESLRALEARFGVTITVNADANLAPGQHFIVERGEAVQPRIVAERVEGEPAAAPERPATARPGPRVVHPEDIEMEDIAEEDVEEDEEAAAGEARSGEPRQGEGGEDRKRRRRRRRRGGRNGESRDHRDGPPNGNGATVAAEAADGDAANADVGADEEEEGEDVAGPGESRDTASAEEKRRRRRRRGGRRNRGEREWRDSRPGDSNPPVEGAPAVAADLPVETVASEVIAPEPVETVSAPAETVIAEKKPRRSRAKKAAEDTEANAPQAVATEEAVADAPAAPAAKRPRTARGKKAQAATSAPASAEIAVEPSAEPADAIPVAPPQSPAAPEIKAAEPVVSAPPAPPPPAPQPEPEIEDPNRPKRSGWWSRAKQAFGGG